MARSGERGDLLTAGLGLGPVGEQVAPKISQDAKWVAAAQDGDRAAFGQLYERYARMVHGVLLAKVPVSAVDDLVQDVFIRALRRLSTLREKASFGAWLAAIARNVARDYHRRTVPEEPLTDDASDRGIQRGVHGEGRDGPAAAALDAVMSLPDAYRETLILRLVEGMTGPEIAARTGMTHGSVRVTRLEARAAKLDATGGPDGLAWFDLGYLAEAYKQWMGKGEPDPAAGFDGYTLVRKAIVLRGSDPEMEFAAALITLRGSGRDHQGHARKAMAGAESDPLLARNLDSHFNYQTIAEVRAPEARFQQ